jgi:uncharacterized protein YjbI with pentapeptide repeats
MVFLNETAMKGVTFIHCKLLGVDFQGCKPFLLSLDFEDCQLNLATFNEMPLKGTRFINCQLQEVDFTEANLTNVLFDRCDLSRAIFARTVLEKADFRTAFNYSLDPETNRIKQAKFSKEGVLGLLDKYRIVIE